MCDFTITTVSEDTEYCITFAQCWDMEIANLLKGADLELSSERSLCVNRDLKDRFARVFEYLQNSPPYYEKRFTRIGTSERSAFHVINSIELAIVAKFYDFIVKTNSLSSQEELSQHMIKTRDLKRGDLVGYSLKHENNRDIAIFTGYSLIPLSYEFSPDGSIPEGFYAINEFPLTWFCYVTYYVMIYFYGHKLVLEHVEPIVSGPGFHVANLTFPETGEKVVLQIHSDKVDIKLSLEKILKYNNICKFVEVLDNSSAKYYVVSDIVDKL